LVSFAAAQETAKTTGEHILQPVFNDDFQTDTRGAYEIAGDVKWESGKLTLGKGASIRRVINGGAWAKLELAFAGDGWGSGDEQQELQIRFVLDGATDCYVRLRNNPDGKDGQSGSVALVDTGEQDGKPITQVVRELPLAKSSLRRLSVEYRYGLVTVTENQSVLLTAHIENGAAAVIASAVHITVGSLELAGWKATSLPAPRSLTNEQQRQAAEALTVNEKLLVLYQQGKFSEAAAVGERMPELWKQALGEDHPDYAASLNNLGRLYDSTLEYARAEPLYEQAADIRRKILGEEHPLYATSLNFLAELYVKMGDYARAQPLNVQARDIFKKVLGEEHPDYAMSLNDLAVLYEATGDHAKAEPLNVQARDIFKKVLGEDHPYYATSLNNLAALYMSRGEYARAEPLFLHARDIWKKVLGEEHPNFAHSLNNLALLYDSMGDYARAERLHVQAWGIQKKVLGEEHPDYAISLDNLANRYGSIGESARAERLHVQARDIRKRVLGEEHPNFAHGCMTRLVRNRRIRP
jgi:lipopolysaccharide biosynthesis regulator YciM